MEKGFWSTLPGVLTAVGGILAATAGLITALYAAGLIGPSKPSTDENKNQPQVASPRPSTEENKNGQQTASAEASRDFVIGRWEVEQQFGEVTGETVVEYKPDGTFTGLMTQFVQGTGQKARRNGRWNFEPLSKNRFRLLVQFDDQTKWEGTFKIMDQNHIHNVDENYVAVRKD